MLLEFLQQRHTQLLDTVVVFQVERQSDAFDQELRHGRIAKQLAGMRGILHRFAVDADNLVAFLEQSVAADLRITNLQSKFPINITGQ